MLNVGLMIALLSALTMNLAFFFKFRGARVAARVDLRHPIASAIALWKSKWFAIGMIVGLIAWGMHVAALTIAPLSLVQAVLAGGVALVAVMADRIFGLHVGRRQWWGLGLTALGLALLALTMPATVGPHATYSGAQMALFEAVLLAVGVVLIIGPRAAGARTEHHGIALAAAAGIMFGACNVSVKALTGTLPDAGLAGVISAPMLIAIAASVGAFYASARSLQLGGAVAVIGITGTASSITCVAGGILVFGDPMPADLLGMLVQGLAFALVIAASALIPASRASQLST
jgi:drug/metabolite transporter (DMT)-like permease